MRRLIFPTLAAVTVLLGCVPVENQRGYVPDQEAVSSIQVGMDNKESVSKKLGDPSTAATFGNDVWYYTQGDETLPGWETRQAWGYMAAVDVYTSTDPFPGIGECP